MPESGKGFDRESFGAGVGVDPCLCQGGGGDGRRKAGGAEVVGESLALLGKGFADEGKEGGLIETEFGEARGKAPAEDGGVDVGRGREG